MSEIVKLNKYDLKDKTARANHAALVTEVNNFVDEINAALEELDGKITNADYATKTDVSDAVAAYKIPTASSSVLGGIKLGYVEPSSGQNYKVQVDANGKAFVHVPWTAGEDVDLSGYVEARALEEARYDLSAYKFVKLSSSNTMSSEFSLTAQGINLNGGDESVTISTNDEIYLIGAAGVFVKNLNIGTNYNISLLDKIQSIDEKLQDLDNGRLYVGDVALAKDLNTVSNTLSALSQDLYEGAFDLTAYHFATETYVSNAVASLVDSSPDALNTLNELAAALGDDPNFATTVAAQIGGKLGKTEKAADSDKLDGQDGSYYLNYNNLSNKPTIPTYTLGSFGITATATELNYVDGVTSNIQTQLNGKLSTTGKAASATVADSANAVAWANVSSKPSFATVATSGSYADLTNKPTIPTKTSQLTNDSGFLKSYTETDPTVPAWAKAASKPSYSYSEITGKPTLATVATSGSYNDLTNKPTIPAAYTLPTASSSVLGGVKTGYTTSGKNYKVQVDSNGNAYVNVPWTDTNTDTNTTYTFAGGTNSFTVTPSGGTAQTVTVTPSIAAASTSAAGLMSSADKSKLDGIAAGANAYSLPLSASGTRGGIQIGYTASGANIPLQLSSEKAYVALTSSAVISALSYTPIKASDLSGYATKSENTANLTEAKNYTDTKIAALINSSPATLDTLDELAAALGDDPNFATTVSTKIGNNTSSITALQTAVAGKLEKTTYEKSAELACGSNGKVCLGKFGAYDTNITIELNSTTSTTYHATIIIHSQNVVANGTGGTVGCYVYGDADNHVTPLISVFRPYGSASRQIEVYASLAGWSKNLVHVQAVALSDGGMTDILTSVSEIPTAITGKTKVTPVNVLTTAFLGKTAKAADSDKLDGQDSSYYLDYNNLSNKPTIPTYTLGSFGITATATELNYVDGVTSNIQTQLNGKLSTTGKAASASVADSANAVAWANVSSKPSFATVATSGSYADLTNKPTIPTKTSQLTNDSGFLKSYTETDPTVPAWAKAASKPSYSYSEITGKPTLATVATSGSYNDLTNKPTIPAAYSLPTASSSELGGIKTGYTTSGKNYKVQVDSSGNAYVNVPWTDTNTDTNTTYTFAGGTNSFTVTPSGGTAQTVTVTPSIAAASTSAAGLMSSADKTKLDGIATGANAYSLPLSASGTRGGIQIGYTASGANIPLQLSSEKAYVALTKSAVTSALGYTPPTSSDISTAISNLVDSSPDTLNTLNELAAALGDDPNFATTIATQIGGKLSTSGGTITGDVTMSATSNANSANFAWGTVNSNTPYFGYASDQTDGTFVWSLKGTNYASGLAIGGGSGNLLWKGTRVATTADIPAAYTLPTASSSTLGGVKVGSNITVNSGTISLSKDNVTTALGYTPPTTNTTYSVATASTAGLVKPVSVITKPTLNSVTTTAGKYYQVQMSSDGNMFVNVPWEAGSGNVDLSGYLPLSGGTITGTGLKVTGSTNGYSVDATGYVKGSWLQTTSGNLSSSSDKICVLDSSGWVYYRTKAQLKSDLGISASDITYGTGTVDSAISNLSAKMQDLEGGYLDLSNYGFLTSIPTASSSTLGGVKTTSTVTSASGYTACPIISGVPYYKDTNTTTFAASAITSGTIAAARLPYAVKDTSSTTTAGTKGAVRIRVYGGNLYIYTS